MTPLDLDLEKPAALTVAFVRAPHAPLDCKYTFLHRGAAPPAPGAAFAAAPRWATVAGGSFQGGSPGAATCAVRAGGAWAVCAHLLADIRLSYGAGPKGAVRIRAEFAMADPERASAASAAGGAEPPDGRAPGGEGEIPAVRPSGASFTGPRPRGPSDTGGGAGAEAAAAAGDAAEAAGEAQAAEAAQAEPPPRQHGGSGADWFASAPGATADGEPPAAGTTGAGGALSLFSRIDDVHMPEGSW